VFGGLVSGVVITFMIVSLRALSSYVPPSMAVPCPFDLASGSLATGGRVALMIRLAIGREGCNGDQVDL
jgi:hypothetical protein